MPERFNWDEILQRAIEESNRKDQLKEKIARCVAIAIIVSAAAANAYFLWIPIFFKK